MTYPRKCKNCNGGNVDGGFSKRVKKDLIKLEDKERGELNMARASILSELLDFLSSLIIIFQ